MKQKMVVIVTMNGQKCRSKALRIAISLSGVESASIKGNDKSRIEVTGDGVDPVQLTSLLRKRMGHAELASVSALASAVAGGEENEQKDKEKPAVLYISLYNPPYDYYSRYYLHEEPYGHYHEPCYYV